MNNNAEMILSNLMDCENNDWGAVTNCGYDLRELAENFVSKYRRMPNMEDIIFMILVKGIKELGLAIDKKERHSKKERNEITKLKYHIHEEELVMTLTVQGADLKWHIHEKEPNKTDFLITLDGWDSYIEINKHKKIYEAYFGKELDAIEENMGFLFINRNKHQKD